MTHPVVTLTWPELLEAAQVGVMRQICNMRDGRRSRYGDMDKGDSLWGFHVNGVAAEMAVAKYFNLLWSGGLGDRKKRDVGNMLDVRSRSLDWQDLDLKDDDPPDVPFVHVWAHPPLFDLYGWVYAREGQLETLRKQLKPDSPADFFVPRSKLRDMSELVTWVRQRVVQQYDAAA
jgi:hypothetical protein